MTSSKDDDAAIRELLEKMAAAESAGDADAWVLLTAEDAILLPQNQPAIVGAPDIRRMWETIFSQVTLSDIKFTTEEVRIAGDWAYLRVSYNHTATLDGTPETQSGKSVWIADRQQDGAWKFTRGIWNSDE